jgi:putative hemolysin
MSYASSISPAEHSQPFSVGGWFEGSAARARFSLLRPIVDHLLALPTLDRLYRAVPLDGRTFWDRALEALDVTINVSDEDAHRIPQDGPLVVVANHPFGGVDGLALASVISRARPDVRLLGNAVLDRIPELRGAAFFVDLYGQSSAKAQNAAAMRAAMRWVSRGGALAMFPAGEVSHVSSADGLKVDREWSTAVARLATRADATVLPVFFHGANSRLFYFAGRMHPALRTALLVRELLRQRGRAIHLRIGSPISPARLRRLDDARAQTDYLRTRTYALGAPAARRHNPAPSSSRERIADPEPVPAMAQEVAALPSEQILLRSGTFTVCMASAAELPHVLREIGRLRELAFRAVGEGSGRTRDLDRFDAHYQHLIVWNHERGEVVGAYRVGQTDDILRRFGVDGLYTSTLFRYDRRLLVDIGPALELGRAFVRPEYQRDYSPLLLLWKGIATFVARTPRYRVLFGTVSISSDYQSLSQQILARFLYATSFRPDLAERVRPRNPPPFLRDGRGVPAMAGAVARTIADVGALVAEIESDGKGVPVLLRQYLKLNARLLGFNVDSAFGGVLDGLMMVDLMDVERDMLARYMGKAGALAFLARHAALETRRAS